MDALEYRDGVGVVSIKRWRFRKNNGNDCWDFHFICAVTSQVCPPCLPLLGHHNLHCILCNIKRGCVLVCWRIPYEYMLQSNFPACFSTACMHTWVSPIDLLLFFCMRQRTIRLRMSRAIKAMAPPVTIPSMGTSTRDCRNSGDRKWRV